MRLAALTIGCFVLVSTLAPGSAEAQRRRPGAYRGPGPFAQPAPSLGVRGGYDFGGDLWSAGAQLRVPAGRTLELIPSGDAFFAGGRTDWQLNADLALRLGPRGGLYAGGGAGLLGRDPDGDGEASTALGPNVFAGIRFPGRRGDVRPFIEARWTFVEGEAPFRLTAGLGFPL